MRPLSSEKFNRVKKSVASKKTLYRLTSIPKSEVNLPIEGTKKIINVFQNSGGFVSGTPHRLSQKKSKASVSTVSSILVGHALDDHNSHSQNVFEMKKVETAPLIIEKD
jgi:hypothetical protein